MPQIPAPVPSVQVADQPLPRVSVNTPEAAFGGATAAAIANLGKTIEGSGTELFSRAIGMKELDNQTEATKAITDYTIQQGEVHADFNELKGGNAKENYQKYIKDSEDLRVRIRNGLSNPAAQRIYDTTSRGILGRNIFNGANHAASEFSRNLVTTSVARVEAAMNEVYQSPDPKTFEANMQVLEAQINIQAKDLGWSQAKRDEEFVKKKSQLASQRTLGLAAKDPVGGDQLFRDYKERGLLQGRDADIVEAKVRGFTQSIGTDAVTREVLDKYRHSDGTFSKSPKEMRDEAVSMTKKMFPDDPKMETATVNAFDRNYSANNYIQTQEARDVKRQTDDYIAKGVTDINMLPQDLVKRMSPQAVKDYPAQANGYLRSKDQLTNRLQYQTLLGMYNEENEKFMDADIMRIPGISKENINFFRKLQRESAPDGDPRVKRAMGWLNGYNPQILADMGVTGRLKDPTVANQFVGALHEAIQSYQEVNGKAPGEKEVTKEIFPMITRKITEKGFLWNSETPYFKVDMPAKYKELYLNEYKRQNPNKPLPDETEIRRDYNRQMFDKFFSGQKATKDQGRVGQ